MEWIAGIFIVCMLGLLVYSIISTSMAIRKKAQPSVDWLFETLYSIVSLKRPISKANRSERLDRK